MSYKYTMYSYKEWYMDEQPWKCGSNNLAYFDKFKNKENHRIVIKEGRKIIYDERGRE